MNSTLSFFLLSVIFGFSLAIPFDSNQKQEWDIYKSKYGKNYASEQENEIRMKIYFDNKRLIEEHNALNENGQKSHILAINTFADLSSEEFNKIMNGYRGQLERNGRPYVPSSVDDLPSSVDWRDKGAVTGVKNQGNCGSCWAFSAAASMEGQYFLKTAKLNSLSEQNLMDCSHKDYGCNGGWMDSAFQYVIDNKGVDTEDSYPYTALDGTCNFNPSSVGATITGFADIQKSNETALQAAVTSVGPISVAINAGVYTFQFYSSGIYYESSCGNTLSDLNHGVTVVGYGSDSGSDYWLVKNSWGETWGDSGYIKMARNRNNNCGIATAASYPIA